MSSRTSAKLTAIQQPPVTTTASGEQRRIGVEIELNGLSLDRLAEVCAKNLSLKIKQSSRYERLLTGDDAGDWRVEVDFQLLKKMGEKDRSKGDISDDIKVLAEDALSRMSDQVVPLELVSPPLPMQRLDEIQSLTADLRQAGAQGTSARAINAFGLQFNPEVPSTDTDVLVRYLKAFLCLADWLVQRSKINLTRKLTSYVDPFPSDYVRQLMDSRYQPDQRQFISDYIDANPTRNRALDCLPLLLHLDHDYVRERCPDPLIKSRPTFHYRLPNCEIHLSGWGIHHAWHDWLEVERLAEDSARLEACCKAYKKYLTNPFQRWFGQWHKQIEKHWLKHDNSDSN